MPNLWTDIPATEYVVGQPIDDTLWLNLETNDEAGIDHVSQLDFVQAGGRGNVYQTVNQLSVSIDPGAKVLRVICESWIQDGVGPGFLQLRLGGSVLSDELSFTSTAPTLRTNTFGDITALRGTLQLLEFRVKGTGVSDEVDIRSLNLAALVQSYD